MMAFFNRYQTVIIVVLLVIAAFIVYTFLFAGEEEQVLSQRTVSEGTVVDHDLITLLLELRSLSLDDAIFSDLAFQSLTDFSQELVPEPVGRVNPFAPF